MSTAPGPRNSAKERLVSLFCSAVYADEDPEVAPRLLRKCLAVCGGSRDLLSKMLQTHFLNGGTPIYFVICNATMEEHTALPPLLKGVLDHCASPLSAAAIDEIQIACCRRNDDELYQHIMAHPNVRGESHGYGFPTARSPSKSNSVAFTVPNYPERMLMAQSVELNAIVFREFPRLSFVTWTGVDCYSQPGTMWNLRFHTSGGGDWCLTMRPKDNSITYTKAILYFHVSRAGRPDRQAEKELSQRGEICFDLNFLRFR